MNQTILNGEWNELKGKIRQKWSKFTDNDMGIIQGNINELIGTIQKTYGYTKEKALEEFETFKASLQTSVEKLSKPGQKPSLEDKKTNEKTVA